METYIKNNITTPLNRAVFGEVLAKTRVIRSMDYCVQRGDTDKLNHAMIPFYELCFIADSSFLDYENWELRNTIGYCMSIDNKFFSWVEKEDNLLDLASCWAECCQSRTSKAFLDLLGYMSKSLYAHPCPIGTDEIRKILVREKIEGDIYSREIHCIMHAFITIWHEKGIERYQKIRLFELLNEHWNYIRALYSAMIPCVVGYNFTEIAAIAHCVKMDLRHHPYLHLFYSAVVEHRERIIRSGTKRDKLDNALLAIREIVTRTAPQGKLDELCRILFSDKLKEYLNRHRLKSYRELESEVTTLRNNLERNTNEMKGLIDKQVRMLSETSIPIEVIYDELKNLSERFPGMAYEVYEKLNALLIKNEAWTKNSAQIRDMIWERMQQPSVQATHYYAPGATHNDESRHISLTPDKKQIGGQE